MSTAPSGWYPDPDDQSQNRYWDGEKWTEHRSPAPIGKNVAKEWARANKQRAKDERSAERQRVKEEEAEQAAEQQRVKQQESAVQQRVNDEWRAEKERIKEQQTAEKERAKEKQRADKQATKDRLAAEQAARQKADRQRYGDLAHSAVFGGKNINIYEKGGVQVLGLLSSAAKTPYEQLISIEASSDVQKKSGLGRGVAAVATMGVNLAASNKRGDVYLTIVTGSQAYALRETPPTVGNMKSSKALEAAGNASIARAMAAEVVGEAAPASAPAPIPASAAPSGDVRDRLQKLQQLFEDGLITQAEYDKKRTTLLDEL